MSKIFRSLILLLAIALLIVSLSCNGKNRNNTGISQVPSDVQVLYPDLSELNPRVSKPAEDLIRQISVMERDGQSKEKLAELFGQLGIFYLSQEYLGAADSAFNKALELDSLGFKWWYFSGVTSRSKGQSEDSISRLKRSVELNDNYQPLLIFLAETLMEDGLQKSAKPYFEKALSKDKFYWPALIGLGQWYLDADLPEESIRYLTISLKQFPNSRKANQLLGSAYRKLGQMENARQVLRKRNLVPVTVKDSLLDQVDIWKDPAQVSLLNADRHALRGEHREAEFDYRESLKVDSLSDIAHGNLALSVLRQGRRNEALQILSSALRVLPKSELLRLTRAKLHYQARENAEAKDLLESILKDTPSHVESRIYLGEILMREGSFGRALREFERVRIDDFGNQKVSRSIAKCKARLGRWEEVHLELDRLNGSIPDLDSKRLLARYFMLSPLSSYEQKERGYLLAEELFQSRAPRDFLIKAMELSAKGRPLAASEMLTKVLRSFQDMNQGQLDALEKINFIERQRDRYLNGEGIDLPWDGYPFDF